MSSTTTTTTTAIPIHPQIPMPSIQVPPPPLPIPAAVWPLGMGSKFSRIPSSPKVAKDFPQFTISLISLICRVGPRVSDCSPIHCHLWPAGQHNFPCGHSPFTASKGEGKEERISLCRQKALGNEEMCVGSKEKY
jgi:hypothetical protein